MIQVLNYIKANKNLIVFISGALFMLLFMRQCNRIDQLKREVQLVQERSDRSFNNYLAARDTIQLERNINGDLVSEIRSYEFEIDALNEENKSLIRRYQTVLNINEEYKEINNLISAELEVKDSIISAGVITFNNDTITVDVVDNKKFDTYNWRDFKGNVSIFRNNDSTYSLLGSNFMFNQGISLDMAIVKKDGYSTLKVSSPYPNLKFTNIRNINLVNDKLNERTVTRKSGWSIGFGVGYGVNLNNQQVINYGPSFGVGLYWSPKWLRF
jgi:hypothetical protein